MLLLLAGCAGSNPLDDTEGVAVEDVLRRVKAEIGLFQSHERAYILQPPLRNACKGYVNFFVPKVKMTLSVVLTTSTGGAATLGAPPLGDAKLGLSVGGNVQGKQTQTLEFTEFPIEPLPPEAVEDDMEELQAKKTPTPMTNALDGLRNAVLAQSGHGPCLDLRQGDADPKNNVSFAIDVDRKNNGGLNFAYTMFSIGATRSGENDYSNKIEISFAPYLNPKSPTEAVKPSKGSHPRKPRPGPVGRGAGRGLTDGSGPGPLGPSSERGSTIGLFSSHVPPSIDEKPPKGPRGNHPERGRHSSEDAVSAGDGKPRPGPIGLYPEHARPADGSDADPSPPPALFPAPGPDGR